MVGEVVLDYDERTGKGGYHRVYRPKLNEAAFKKYVTQTAISSLMKNFPAETKKALKLDIFPDIILSYLSLFNLSTLAGAL